MFFFFLFPPPSSSSSSSSSYYVIIEWTDERTCYNWQLLEGPPSSPILSSSSRNYNGYKNFFFLSYFALRFGKLIIRFCCSANNIPNGQLQQWETSTTFSNTDIHTGTRRERSITINHILGEAGRHTDDQFALLNIRPPPLPPSLLLLFYTGKKQTGKQAGRQAEARVCTVQNSTAGPARAPRYSIEEK